MINCEELLQRTANNDTAAFKLLYEKTSPKLYSLILKIVISENLAEEVLQLAYRTLWDRADRYDSTKGSVISWISVITLNTAIETLRTSSSLPEDIKAFYINIRMLLRKEPLQIQEESD
jgi:RNA polymerase sigma-70 factor (ECF subfamily)